ncbi:MAG: hypothetical protein ACYTGL_20845 [Planctomycetota bacterium]|jgi:hypothetical protein
MQFPRLTLATLLISFAISFDGRNTAAADPSIEYLGHIDVPHIEWNQKTYAAGRHFGYSRGTFCYVPERDSFLLIGHPIAQLFAEISNPGPGGQADLLHDFVDVTQGGLAKQSAKYGHVHLQSLLYDNGRVLLGAEKWYNVSNRTIETHGSFTPDLDHPQFDGWWRVAGHLGQTTSYYMTRLPERFVRDGRWLLTGGSLTWRSGSSPGPCAILVDPDDVQPGDTLTPDVLLRYQVGRKNPLRINYRDATHRGHSANSGGVAGWMGGCNVGGVVALGDRLVFFGRQGKGYDYYGTGAEYRRLTGLEEPRDSKGYRSGPYESAMWIYSLDALQRNDRSVIRMPFPWSVAERGHHDLRNACRHRDRIYVCEAFAKWFGEQPLPVIHVLQVTGLSEESDNPVASVTTATE